MIRTVEIPCIEHGPGAEVEKLAKHLQESYEKYLYILITSPESAHVFVREWKAIGSPLPIAPLAVVGASTAVALRNEGLDPAFVPTKSNGVTLASELPIDGKNIPSSSTDLEVLYPASEKASNDIAKELAKRNVKVVRVNTYTTRPASWSDTMTQAAISDVHVAAFGSPSAVKAWKANLSQNTHEKDINEDTKEESIRGVKTILAACIGETTARACREEGVGKMVFCGGKPGMDGWLKAVLEALEWCKAEENLAG